jgi:hypothetical protein
MCVGSLNVVWFFIVTPSTEATLAEGCSNNDECPDHTACENRLCINPCAYHDPCAPTAHCQVINHKPVCSCPDGYIGSPTTSCTLRKEKLCTINHILLNIYIAFCYNLGLSIMFHFLRRM